MGGKARASFLISDGIIMINWTASYYCRILTELENIIKSKEKMQWSLKKLFSSFLSAHKSLPMVQKQEKLKMHTRVDTTGLLTLNKQGET